MVCLAMAPDHRATSPALPRATGLCEQGGVPLKESQTTDRILTAGKELGESKGVSPFADPLEACVRQDRLA